MPVLGAQQQGAGVIQRLGATANLALASLNRHVAANRLAMRFPFVRHLREATAANPRIIAIQFAQNRRRQFGARNRFARFNFERSRQLAQFRWKLARAQIYVHADAQDDVTNPVQFRAQLGQNARDFFPAN